MATIGAFATMAPEASDADLRKCSGLALISPFQGRRLITMMEMITAIKTGNLEKLSWKLMISHCKYIHLKNFLIGQMFVYNKSMLILFVTVSNLVIHILSHKSCLFGDEHLSLILIFAQIFAPIYFKACKSSQKRTAPKIPLQLHQAHL